MDSSLIMSEIESSQVTDHNASKSSIESQQKMPQATKNPFLDCVIDEVRASSN